MVTASPALAQDIDEILPGVVADRRHLHQYPELGFQEFETAKFVAERLRSLGLDDVQTEVGRTGVVGILKGGKPGKVVALRADMEPAEARSILERLADDEEDEEGGLRDRIRKDPKGTFEELGVDIGLDLVPSEVVLPPAGEVRRALQLFRARELASGQGEIPLWLLPMGAVTPGKMPFKAALMLIAKANQSGGG